MQSGFEACHLSRPLCEVCSNLRVAWAWLLRKPQTGKPCLFGFSTTVGTRWAFWGLSNSSSQIRQAWLLEKNTWKVKKHTKSETGNTAGHVKPGADRLKAIAADSSGPEAWAPGSPAKTAASGTCARSQSLSMFTSQNLVHLSPSSDDPVRRSMGYF